MLQDRVLKSPSPLWQQALSNLITNPLELLSLLEISPELIPWQWDKHFPVRVTRSFIARMEKGNPHDPLLKQVLSRQEESQFSASCSSDPLQEKAANPIPGLLHKFEGRVLLTFTSSCAIHCRYCFRRHFPYQENNPGRHGWSRALDYIAQRPEITEVILSGGDPLMAGDDHIALFVKQLANIAHVRFLRIHTRLPVVIPERITSTLIQALGDRFNVVFVYHINHWAEMIPAIAEGVKRLKNANITVLNQTVLLKDVNDSPACLKKLCEALWVAGILPYYVHLLDPVKGAHHFAVDLSQAKDLQSALRQQLPGYLVPRFVKEVPLSAHKVPLDLLP